MTEQEPPTGAPVAPGTADLGATPGQEAAPLPGPGSTSTPGSVGEESRRPEPLEVGPEVSIAKAADPTYVRRAPRFGAFIFVAIFLAALIAGLASFVRDAFLPPEQLVGRALDSGGMFLLLFFVLAPFLSLVAYALAVWLDRRSVKRLVAAQRRAGVAVRDFTRAPGKRKAAQRTARERTSSDRPTR